MTYYLGWSTHDFSHAEWRAMARMLMGPVVFDVPIIPGRPSGLNRAHVPEMNPYRTLRKARIADQYNDSFTLTEKGRQFAAEFAAEYVDD